MKLTTALLSSMCLAASLSGAELKIEKRYLHVPVADGGEPQMVQFLDGDEVTRYFAIALPASRGDALYWSSTDMGPWKGKTLTVKTDSAEVANSLVGMSEQSDAIRKPAGAYRESHRPQFHFSPMVGWTNDPNGLVYWDGEYHLFFQHNPYGTEWGNMTWGHAVSPDLVHWKEIGDALYADRLGTMYSGSAVVDHRNTSGFGAGSTPPMVTFFTAAGQHSYDKQPYTQAIAYSLDRGRSWTKYAGNPVVGHIEGTNRDPKVFWHKSSNQWVMVLYLSRGKFVLMGSSNLKQWRKLSEIPFDDGHECPELFELPVDGDPSNTRWVMWEGAGRHLIGRFDGKQFTSETGILPAEWGTNTYAAQTWNDVPGGRRILIAWMRARKARTGSEPIYPGMPFNQQMSFPRELTLKTTDEGIRLHAWPIREIETLYAKTRQKEDFAIKGDAISVHEARGELLDIELRLDPGKAKTVTFDVRGTPVVYDATSETLSAMGKSVRLPDTPVKLRFLVDRTSLEIFAADGRYVLSFCFRPKPESDGLSLAVTGGSATLKKLKVRQLDSIW